MKPSTQYTPQKTISILCVGNPGTGKTRLMFSLPRPGILDVDLNMGSAIRVAPNKSFMFSQPVYDDKGIELPKAQRWPNAVKETKLLIASPDTESICIDGLTTLSEWLLEYAEAKLIEAGINVKKEYLAKYQNFINLMTEYITMLRIGGKYVYVTCHQTADKNDISGAWYYNLAIPGQLKDRLGGLFSDVWGTGTTVVGDSVKYFVSTRPTNMHVALKTSFDLPPKFDVTDKKPEEIWSTLSPLLSYEKPAPKP
jgi:hypothetical protein